MDEDFLPGLKEVFYGKIRSGFARDKFNGIAFFFLFKKRRVLFNVSPYVSNIKKRRPFKPDINKGRLHSRKYLDNLSHVDIADKACIALPLNIEFNYLPAFKESYSYFFMCCINQDFADHVVFLSRGSDHPLFQPYIATLVISSSLYDTPNISGSISLSFGFLSLLSTSISLTVLLSITEPSSNPAISNFCSKYLLAAAESSQLISYSYRDMKLLRDGSLSGIKAASFIFKPSGRTEFILGIK